MNGVMRLLLESEDTILLSSYHSYKTLTKVTWMFSFLSSVLMQLL